MSDSKELVEHKTQLPVEDLGVGFDDMDGQDFSAPFLVICQSTSPYLKPEHQLYIPDAKPSMIINAQNMNCYTAVTVIPCKYSFRNVEWKPRGSGGGFVASYHRENTPTDLSTDALTGRIVRPNGNEVLPTAYYLCMLMEEGFDRVIIPMYSTQLKKSRKWNSMMVSIKQGGKALPIFAHSWKLTTVSESNAKGSWYGWKSPEIEDYIPDLDMDVYNQAKELGQIDNFLPEKLLEAQAVVTGQTTTTDAF